MRATGFEQLRELMKNAEVIEPTTDELQQKVKAVFKRSLDMVKGSGTRPTLAVGKSFLENYHRDHGISGMENLLSKISLLVKDDGFEYLVSIGVIKRK